MKKKNVKNLSLKKKVISKLSSNEITGGDTCYTFCGCLTDTFGTTCITPGGIM